MKLQAAQKTIVGLHIRRLFRLGRLLGLPLYPADHGGDDRRGQLVLNIEEIVKLAVVLLRPNVIALGGVDQLRGDPHTLADPPDAAFQAVGDAQFAPNLA